jgi:hypothetical protein
MKRILCSLLLATLPFGPAQRVDESRRNIDVGLLGPAAGVISMARSPLGSLHASKSDTLLM